MPVPHGALRRRRAHQRRNRRRPVDPGLAEKVRDIVCPEATLRFDTSKPRRNPGERCSTPRSCRTSAGAHRSALTRASGRHTSGSSIRRPVLASCGASRARCRLDHLSTEILLSDYAGHPFTVELARGLAESGVDMRYSYCAAVSSPKGKVAAWKPPGCARTWCSRSTTHGSDCWPSNPRYGIADPHRPIWRVRPETHVVCNMPVISALVAWLPQPAAPRAVDRLVSRRAVRDRLEKSWRRMDFGVFSGLESLLLRRGVGVIAISESLAVEARQRGVRPVRVTVLQKPGTAQRHSDRRSGESVVARRTPQPRNAASCTPGPWPGSTTRRCWLISPAVRQTAN